MPGFCHCTPKAMPARYVPRLGEGHTGFAPGGKTLAAAKKCRRAGPFTNTVTSSASGSGKEMPPERDLFGSHNPAHSAKKMLLRGWLIRDSWRFAKRTGHGRNRVQINACSYCRDTMPCIQTTSSSTLQSRSCWRFVKRTWHGRNRAHQRL